MMVPCESAVEGSATVKALGPAAEAIAVGDGPAAAEAAAPRTLEQRLRASFHRGERMPKAKELHESFAFFKAIDKELRGLPQREPWPVVIDVAGGHGILAALVLIYGRARRAVVVDPHRPQNAESLLKAWAPFLAQASAASGASGAAAGADAVAGASGEHPAPHLPIHGAPAPRERASPVSGAPEYLQEDLRTALPRLLAAERGRVLVLACHACAHLTEQIVAACAARRPLAADFCVMPCCQRAPQALKQATKAMRVDVGAAMDFVLMGERAWGPLRVQL